MAAHDITDLIARIEAVGGTVDQLTALEWVGIQNLTTGTVLVAGNRRAEEAANTLVERLETAHRVRTHGPLATDRQIAYIGALGGTATDGMTKAEASALIDQLKRSDVRKIRRDSAVYGSGFYYSDQPGATYYDGGRTQIWDNA